MRFLLAVLAVLFGLVPAAAAQPSCFPVQDPKMIITQAKEALRDGRFQGMTLEGAEAIAFAKDARILLPVVAVLIVTGLEPRLGVLFRFSNGNYGACFGPPTEEAKEAIKHLGVHI